ncbi:hypothetical protein HMPREF9629_01583 [Peptoanaerobacter stomatis]|uniref:PF09148 domain protein n=1 Tax=Peptoanaerobacter stomatis TaxID=796937 RepID=G9WZI2_9FIRM|nr:DUF1934 domain-containing protein [Peptoanaerobacter stomatis]EHL16008.1 hypothetical protein HMPREF9629_01583 [Peptoanaerobacter stomatis]
MNVTVKINTLQIDLTSNKKDNIDFESLGSIKSVKNIDLIKYEESEITGLNGNTTVLKIEKDSVTMLRYGKNCGTMYFKEGISSKTLYNTDYGSFELEIFTKKLNIEKYTDDLLYKINIEYDINIKDLFNGLNILDITVKNIK